VTTYPINEMFFSLQGEGARAGSANVFVRFAGCNQTCSVPTHGFDCDTEFVSHVRLTGAEIMLRIQSLWKADCKPSVILTGGEPLLSVTEELAAMLIDECETVAVETNGSLPMPTSLFNDERANVWIACSPKVAEHAVQLQRADELRYVRHDRQGIPKPRLEALYKYLSPAWVGGGFEPGAMKTCRRLIAENPTWSLSTQQHKLWGVR